MNAEYDQSCLLKRPYENVKAQNQLVNSSGCKSQPQIVLTQRTSLFPGTVTGVNYSLRFFFFCLLWCAWIYELQLIFVLSVEYDLHVGLLNMKTALFVHLFSSHHFNLYGLLQCDYTAYTFN